MYDQWNPRSAGQKEWDITQQLGARPATPADAAAWRAAGSPAAWHSGDTSGALLMSGYLFRWPLDATTAASAQVAGWQVSDGTVGYVEGDERGLKAAQFRQMPTSPRAVKAVLLHYYPEPCAQPHGGCSTEDHFVWGEALALLQDPVSAQVRSATLKVMASLPGVRLLGPMTDPLGRRGYGLAAGPNAAGGAGRNGGAGWNSVSAAVIDPRTGSLLATEDIGLIPRNLQCLRLVPAEGAAGRGKPVVRLRFPHGKSFLGACVGPSFEGRSYQGQVGDYTVLVSAGWTSASPVLPPPSTWQAHTGFPGLNAAFVPMGRPGPPGP